MSDQRLRQLERRWRQTGAVQDESSYMLEKIRLGEIPREMLRLAAIFGHPAAKLSYPKEQSLGTMAIERWPHRLIEFGKPTLIRTALALAMYCAKRCRTTRILGRYQAARQWAICPCDQHREEAWATTALDYEPEAEDQEEWIERILYFTAAASGRRLLSLVRAEVIRVLELCHHIGGPTTNNLIEEMLIPWALGYSDPLRDSPDQDPPRT